jgi:hypothetical protein
VEKHDIKPAGQIVQDVARETEDVLEKLQHLA